MRSQGNSRLVYSTESGRQAKSAAAPEPLPQLGRHGIRLRLERRASGRVVTVVTGLPGSKRDLQALLSVLRSACGAGGSLKDDVVEIQGDQRDRVEAELRTRGLQSKRAGG